LYDALSFKLVFCGTEHCLRCDVLITLGVLSSFKTEFGVFLQKLDGNNHCIAKSHYLPSLYFVVFNISTGFQVAESDAFVFVITCFLHVHQMTVELIN
jgi:hypothetical protein